MERELQFGDAEALQRALSGSTLGNARVDAVEAIREIGSRVPEVKAVALAALVSAGVSLPTASASAAGLAANVFTSMQPIVTELAAGNSATAANPAADEVVLKPGDSIWREALIFDAKNGGMVRATVTEIESENNISPDQVRDLAVDRVLKMPEGAVSDNVQISAKPTMPTARPDIARPSPKKVITTHVSERANGGTPAAPPIISSTNGGTSAPITKAAPQVLSKPHSPASVAKSGSQETVKPKSIPTNTSTGSVLPASPNEQSPSQEPASIPPANAPAQSPAVKPQQPAALSAVKASDAPKIIGSTPQPITSVPIKPAIHHDHHQTVLPRPQPTHESHHSTKPHLRSEAHHLARVKYVAECGLNSHHSLIGATPAAKIFAYLIYCDGDSIAGAAGMLGNFEHEDSTLSPQRIESGGFSTNPGASGNGGYGIAQWTPGIDVVKYEAEYGIDGAPDNLRTQLELVSSELKGHSPDNYPDLNAIMRRVTDPSEAAYLADLDFEAPLEGGNLPDREQLAEQAMQEYQALLNSHPSSVHITTSRRTVTSSITPQEHNKVHKIHKHKKHIIDHVITSGPNSAIYYAALRYNTASYALAMVAGHEGDKQWHRDFPQIGPDAEVDCSGLVNLAVGTATGGRVEINDNTTTELTDKANWERITFSQARRGDLIQPDIGDPHVEIVSYVKGDVIHTFGAHTSLVAQPQQVGPAEFTYNPNDVFLRYVGMGAPLGSQIETPVKQNPIQHHSVHHKTHLGEKHPKQYHEKNL